MTGLNIAITGGTGYIGSRMADYLLIQGYNVVILSRSFKESLPERLQKITKVVDFEDKSSLTEVLKHVNCIIHLMSLNEHEAKEKPEEAAYVNVYLTEVLLQAAIQAGVNRFFYFSTVHVYGSPLLGMIDETHITRPSHPYSVVHKAAEEFVLEKILTNRMDGVIFRVSNGFGYPLYKAINRWTLLVNDICRQAVENKKIVIKSKNQKRDFITISDIVHAVDWFLKKDLLKDYIINLSSSKTMTIGEMTELVVESCFNITGEKVSVIYEDESENSTELIISNDKLLNSGFSMSNNYKEEISATITNCIEWFS